MRLHLLHKKRKPLYMRAVINVNTLEDVEEFSRHAQVMNYEDESLAERMERREKNWIGQVEIEYSG